MNTADRLSVRGCGASDVQESLGVKPSSGSGAPRERRRLRSIVLQAFGALGKAALPTPAGMRRRRPRETRRVQRLVMRHASSDSVQHVFTIDLIYLKGDWTNIVIIDDQIRGVGPLNDHCRLAFDDESIASFIP